MGSASTEKRLIKWLLSDDTGSSSRTIVSVMTRTKYKDPSPPYDQYDFGRCHRLLLEIPEWKEKLPLLGKKYPIWKPLVDDWSRLENLYNTGLKTGDFSVLYRTLQHLLKRDKHPAVKVIKGIRYNLFTGERID